jgi:hypothetical protein
MNNFIKQNFDSKKDEPFSKFGQKKTSVRNSKNNSRIVSRKTSPLRLSAQGSVKNTSYIQPNENKNHTIVFNEPTSYHKKTQSAIYTAGKKKKNKDDLF